MAAPKPFHVAIVGGGITGLALALALQKRGVAFTIYEQAAAFGEIGAGVGMHANAVRAMRLCDPAMLAGFERVATRNAWPSKSAVWFDVLDGTAEAPAAPQPGGPPGLAPLFTLEGHADGHAACHRARFLDELVPLLPAGAAQFGKRLAGIEGNDDDDQPLTLRFEDGSSAQADAVLGCDGIKSRTRAVLLGDGPDSPAAQPSYSRKFVYRGLLPMADAAAALGEERAANAVLWVGPDRHALTFPVNHGTTLNLVAFVTTADPWPAESTTLTLPATRDDALRDFAGFGPNVLGLLRMTAPQLERWGLFDLADRPLPRFYRGRVCLVGDAAHASTPHHGAGAGLCIEDAAVLAALLADPAVAADPRGAGLRAAFAAFDGSRRGRDQWLVASSRRAADLYEQRVSPGRERDFAAVAAEVLERQAYIWDIDLDAAVAAARADLARRVALGLPEAAAPDPAVPSPPDIDFHLRDKGA